MRETVFVSENVIWFFVNFQFFVYVVGRWEIERTTILFKSASLVVFIAVNNEGLIGKKNERTSTLFVYFIRFIYGDSMMILFNR